MNYRTLVKLFCVSALMLAFNNCEPVGQSGGEGDGNNNSNTGPQSNFEKSAEFFNDVVSPQFEVSCRTCHDRPANLPPGVDTAGTENVFNFNLVRENIIAGTDAINNRMIDILTNDLVHDPQGDGPGNLCFQGSAAGICALMIRWWNIEMYGDEDATSPFLAGDEDPGAALTVGRLSSVSILGRVFGYARNPSDADDNVDVHIYEGGPQGVGTLLATVQANENGPGGRHRGHYFSYDLPSNLLDGQNLNIYVYSMNDSDPANLLAGAPYAANAWEYSTDAENYFNANVQSSFQNSCTRCHGEAGYQYSNRFYSMASPSPANGGTASNNLLVRKLSGQEGHGGGTFCTSANSGVCAQVQEVWRRQFQ